MQEGMSRRRPAHSCRTPPPPAAPGGFNPWQGGTDAWDAIGSPCIIVVGAVASLSKEIFDDVPRPLAGRTVLITRPSHLALQTASLFADNGARVVLYPLLDISPLPFDLPDVNAFDLFIFTSQNAVLLFMNKMLAANLDARSFGRSKIYCIGPKPGTRFSLCGIRADGTADEYRAEGSWRCP